MYDILFHKNAEKQLEKLPREIQIRVLSVLDRIKISPHSHVKKLVNTPYFRLRVGDYRIILDIQSGKLIIFVIELGHIKNIYD
jgi:mRNA interferase RelE/StbE